MGRPDGRLNALTSAENTVCLSANQASSIQNFGVTAETLTVGHHPFKLPLSAEAIFLPTGRKLFVCEAELQEKAKEEAAAREAAAGPGSKPNERAATIRQRMNRRAGTASMNVPVEASNANSTIASLEALEDKARPPSPVEAIMRVRNGSMYAGAKILGRIARLAC